MAISDLLQTSISAFIFGSLFQTAVAAVLLYLRGHGLRIIQDRRRLVLVIFLTTAAVWAQLDFINYAVPPTSESACQVTVAISTFLDQAGRTTIGGFLLWSVGHVRKSKLETYGLGALVGTRAVLGLVFVGFTRPQFSPVCVARSEMLSISAAVIAVDVIVTGILTIRIFTLGFIEMIRDVRSATKQEQSKALVYCTAGFLLWTITSSAMLLGIESIILLLRTAPPAIGLLVLITLMTLQSGALVLPLEQSLVVPEARSPFVPIRSRPIESISERNGSPISNTGYRKTGRLFVVNPCSILSSARNTIFQRDSKAGSTDSARFAPAIDNGVENGHGDSVRVFDGQPMAAGAIISATAAAGLRAQSREPRPKKMTIAERRQKRTFLGRGNGGVEESIPKLAISGPIPQVYKTSHPQSLKRAKVIEVKTAATDELSRHEEAASTSLVATRVAPLPPVVATSDALRKVSIKRQKEGSSLTTLPKQAAAAATILPSGSDLSLDVKAASTSASLSPGSRDVRRRSPRTLKGLGRDPGPSEMKKLPETPRERSPRSESKQAVIYVDGIRYDQPSSIKSAIKGATSIPTEQKLPGEQKAVDPPKISNPISAGSIIHRPRPQKRNSEQYRAIFPSQHSPDIRTKPGPSGISEEFTFAIKPKGVADSPVLSPRQRPTSAAALRRLLPHDTRSMTVCEKISLLFPAPPETPSNRSRRSSVPSLPRIPSVILGPDPLGDILTEKEHQNRVSLRRKTISFGACPYSEAAKPVSETTIMKDYNVFESTPTRIPEISIGNVENLPAAGMKVAIMRGQETSAFSVSDFDGDEYQDTTKSAYGSLHSPIPAVDITTAMQTARETYIQMRKEPTMDGKSSKPISSMLLSKEDRVTITDDGEGFMTVMLGVGAAELQDASINRTFLVDTSPSIQCSKQTQSQGHTWHRRIGDELLTFSERRKHSTTQSTPPPPPLQLSSTGRLATVISREPAAEEVVDTPGKAVRAIQAQLSKFDGPGRGSLGFLSRYVPHDSLRALNENNDALGLIANLEKEMGQQETHWMQMQHNLSRDSNSVIMTPPYADLKSLPSPPSEESSQRGSPRMGQRLRTRSPISKKPRSEHSIATPSTQNSESSRASAWQRRLAEAQLDFTENKSALVGGQFINFLSMSKVVAGSPTPPDSLDSGSDSGSDVDCADEDASYNNAHESTITSVKTPQVELLWKPKPSPPAIMVGHLWSQVLGRRGAYAVSFEPPMLMVRRRPQRDHQPLLITSSALWSKPVSNQSKSSVGGLWGAKKTRPKCIVNRPKTQRPERKSKRMTFLPDIIENPSPLPNKRGTLGIFQFPWGEKSDSAVYGQVPLPNYANLQDLAFNHYLETKPLPVPPEMEELEEYSSTFFGEYGEIYGDGSDGTSDDDFDESTLWEIANLLHSHNVPSKESFLPQPRIIEDYDDDDFSESDITESIQVYNQVDHTPPQSPPAIALPLHHLTSPIAQPWVETGEQTVSKVETSQGKPKNLTGEQTCSSPINEHIGAEPSNETTQLPITSKNLWNNDMRTLPSQPIRANINLWNEQIVVKNDDLSSSDTDNRLSESASVSEVDTAVLGRKENQLTPTSPRRASIRGSKVLASRDLWESKVETPALSHEVAKKTRRSSKLIVPDVFRQEIALDEATSLVSMEVTSKKTVDTKSSQLWKPFLPAMSKESDSGRLWTTKVASGTDAPHRSGQEAGAAGTRIAPSSPMPVTLSSSSFWSPEVSVGSVGKHWLHDTSLQEAQVV